MSSQHSQTAALALLQLNVQGLTIAPWTVSRCLRATPTTNCLSSLVLLQQRSTATLALTRKAQMSESHLLHKIATETPQHLRLKSHTPKNFSAQYRLIPPQLPGSREDEWKSAEPRLVVFLSSIGGLSGAGRSGSSPHCNLHTCHQ